MSTLAIVVHCSGARGPWFYLGLLSLLPSRSVSCPRCVANSSRLVPRPCGAYRAKNWTSARAFLSQFRPSESTWKRSCDSSSQLPQRLNLESGSIGVSKRSLKCDLFRLSEKLFQNRHCFCSMQFLFLWVVYYWGPPVLKWLRTFCRSQEESCWWTKCRG